MKKHFSPQQPEGQVSRSTEKPTHDQIAALAYQFYVENGRQEGREVQDWLRAEAWLMQQPARAATTPSNEAAQPQNISAPQGIRPLNTPEYPLAPDKPGSASREQIQRQPTQVRPPARQSQRPIERAGQAR